MDECHKLSVGDDTASLSSSGHQNMEDAASGDVDKVNEKSDALNNVVTEDCNETTQNEKASEGLSVISDDAPKMVDNDKSPESKTIEVAESTELTEKCDDTTVINKDVISVSSDLLSVKLNEAQLDTQQQDADVPKALNVNFNNSVITGTNADTLKISIDNEANTVASSISDVGKLSNKTLSSENTAVQKQDESCVSVVDENKSDELPTTASNADKNSVLKSPDKGTDMTESCKTIDKFAVGDQHHKSTSVVKKPLETDSILHPLMLEDAPLSPPGDGVGSSMQKKLTFSPSRHKMLDTETPCMICDHIESNMDIKSHYDEYLCHMIVEHKLVIADVKLIANLQSYAIYWKKRFSEERLETFCSKIKTNTGATDIAESEEYYLLCDALPEDKKKREELQFDKLKSLLVRQEFERKDESFSRMCPFCSKLFQGNRLILFNHMTVDHNFNIGHPDNIVNVRELLDDIQSKLDQLQCLFCENVFRDRITLREHMRKKGHRRLNPENKAFDKYYMINYLELGKNWLVLQSESEKLEGSTDDWSGWFEEAQKAYCFFCKTSFDQADKVYTHMKDVHEFDFILMRQEMQLSFYQQIKLINYIRRRVHMGQQEGCADVITKIKDDLKANTKWNQPQYYFSTYEDDTILCQLEDKEGVFEPEDTFVIGEDGIDCRNIISSSVLTDLVVHGFFDS